MKKFKTSITLFFTFNLVFFISYAQQLKVIKDVPYSVVNFESDLNAGVNNLLIQTSSIGLSEFNAKIISAKVYVYLDANLNQNTAYRIEGNKSSSASFKLENQNLSYTSDEIKLDIDAKNPKAIYYVDLTKYGERVFGTTLKINVNSISNIANTSTLHKKFKAKVELTYGSSIVQQVPTELTTSAVVITPNSKQIKFSWNNTRFSPTPVNYEFQLLRLYNTDQSKTNQTAITTELDWSKAMSLETQNSNTSLSLTLSEGTGFYAWRVRPIANYYQGGYSNSLNKNEQQWSYPSTKSAISLVKNAITNQTFFYFEDADDNKNINYIYTRYFTEGGKIKESITYADGLQQVKQTQVYMPSKDIDGTNKESNIISQNFQDKSGRNALSTMPEPNNGKINGYKEAYIKNKTTDRPYTVEDFDNDISDKPNQVKTAKDYYGANPDLSIPDAQGYNLTKTKFSVDGSNRVAEQSGVGKTHMIGEKDPIAQQTHTNRTFFGTASDEELIKLFGDEAPADGTVFKTVNQDPNGTQSVQYTSKEGQVIATGIIDDTEISPLLPIDKNGYDDEMSKYKGTSAFNIVSDGSLISVKRFIVNKTQDVTLKYKVEQKTLPAGCNDLKIDCGHSLTVKVFNADDMSPIVFPSTETQLPNDTKISTLPSSPESTNEIKVIDLGTHSLPPGSYIISKKLTAGKVNASLSLAEARTGIQIKPLTGVIKSWLENIKCKVQLIRFYVFMTKVESAFTSLAAGDKALFESKMLAIEGEDNIAPIRGFKEYVDNIKEDYKVDEGGYPNYALEITKHPTRTYTSADGTVYPKLNRVNIRTPCCQISVSLNWTPPFRCPNVSEMHVKNTNRAGGTVARIDVHPNYGDEDTSNDEVDVVPDFEGYALNFLSECNDENNLQNRFNRASSAAASSSFPPDLNNLMEKVFPGENPFNIRHDKLLKSFFYGLMRGWRKINSDNLLVPKTDIDEYISKDDGGIVWARVEEDGYVEGEGTFNLMVYHMLTDRYISVGLDPSNQQPLIPTGPINSNTTPIYDECGNSTTPEPQGAVCNADNITCTQYTCDQLISCWLALIQKAKINVCISGFDGMNTSAQNGGPSKEYDKRKNDGGKDHNSKFDDKLPKFIDCDWWPCTMVNDVLDWATGTSRKVREAQEEANRAGSNVSASVPPVFTTYNENIPSDFLKCVGYKFAAILSPETEVMAKPLNEDINSSFNYFKKDNHNGLQKDILGSLEFDLEYDINKHKKLNGGGDVDYVPFLTWKCQSNLKVPEFNEFPFIYNPVYAFKYFTYLSPSSAQYSDLERANCYRDPNDCYEYVLENGTYKGVPIPCCAVKTANGKFDYSKCYKDFDYPNVLVYAQTQNNYRDETASTISCVTDEAVMGGITEKVAGKPTRAYKYIVRNFCGYDSRIKCMYDNHYWSSGQREGFYTLLKSFTPPSNAPDWQNATIPQVCEDYITPYEWATYSNQNTKSKNDLVTATNEAILQCIAAGKFGLSLSQCINEKMKAFTGVSADPVSIVRPIKAGYSDGLNLIPGSQIEWNNPAGDAKITKVSRIDVDIFKMNNECVSACDKKRSSFHQKLDQLLKDRCYVRNNCCQESEQTNIVTDKDYYAMIDAMVAQCSGQCKLQSFTCKNLNCRERNIAVDAPGISGNMTDIKFGIGNSNIPNSPTTGTALENLAPKPDYVYNNSLGLGLYDYSEFLSNNPTCESGNFTQNPSFEAQYLNHEQYMLWKQASTWDFTIDLPSKCPVGQAPSSNINCDNPATNTFVPLSVYEQNANTPVDVYNMGKDVFNNHASTPSQNYTIINGKIISPAIKLDVKVINTRP